LDTRGGGTPDGRRLICGSDKHALTIWDLATEQVIGNLYGHTSEVSCLAVTTDGRRAVSGSGDTTLKVWDLETSTELLTLYGHPDIRAIAITQDGRRAVSVGAETVKVWDLEKGLGLHTLTGHTNWVDEESLSFTSRPSCGKLSEVYAEMEAMAWKAALGA
jgi:WD40 repeat protein